MGDNMYLTIDSKNIEIKIANNFFKKIKRLLFKNKIDCGLLIPECTKVSTYFFSDNVDILVLNNKNSVLYKFQNIPKNKIVIVDENKKKTSFLELPKNTSQNIKIGDVLTFENKNII